ncbi:hypothetical protein Tco_0664421 [Tanacetum coccineum]
MTMRTKLDVDTLSIDNLYNNLRVFEQELTSNSKSSVSAQNVAFVSHSKSSTNNVRVLVITSAYSTVHVLLLLQIIFQKEKLLLIAMIAIRMKKFYKKTGRRVRIDGNKPVEQIDDLDIEEMDINWQIAMIAIRMKKFYKKTGRRVRIDGNKPLVLTKKSLNVSKCSTLGSLCLGISGKKEQNQNYLLTMDDGVVNWGEHTVEEAETNHALMAINSNNKGPQKHKTSVSDDKFNEYSTCQSNDSEGSFGNPSEHSVEEAELKNKFFNTGNGVAKPVWNNANRVNHANHFVSRPVQLNAVRPKRSSTQEHGGTSIIDSGCQGAQGTKLVTRIT